MLPYRIARPNPRILALIIAALAIRLLLMPVAAYGDMHAIAYALHLLGFQGIANVYAALHVLPLEQSPVPNLGIDFFPYPPLTYFVLGGAMALLRPLYGDGFSSAVSSLFPAFVAHPPQIFLWLTLYKLPLLVADLGIAATLAAFGETTAQRWRLAAIWLLNPVPIVAAYLFGQFDVLPALCVLLAYLAVVRGHPWLGAVALGVGAGFKTFPLLLLLPFAIVVGKSWLQRGALTAVGLLTFAAAFLPVATDPVTFEVVLGADPAQRVFRSGIPLGEVFETQGMIYLVFLGWGLVTLHAAQSAAGRPAEVWRFMLAVLLLTYAFAYSHLQWFTWAVPFLVLDWERRPENRLLHAAMSACVLAIGLSWQVGPMLEFFRPVSPALAAALPEFNEVVQVVMPGPDLANILRSLLAGAVLYWTWTNVFREPQEQAVPESAAIGGPVLLARKGDGPEEKDQAAV